MDLLTVALFFPSVPQECQDSGKDEFIDKIFARVKNKFGMADKVGEQPVKTREQQAPDQSEYGKFYYNIKSFIYIISKSYSTFWIYIFLNF